MERLVQDLRHALRSVARTRGPTIVAILTLGVAIGLNVSVFSLVNAISFRPLPYAEPEQLDNVWLQHVRGLDRSGVSGRDVLDWVEAVRSYEAIALWDERTLEVRLGEDAEGITGTIASANLFDVLGVRARLGRGFVPEDELPSSEEVVVLSYSFWQERFEGDPEILGRELRVAGRLHRVVGVMPERFGFLDFARLYVPLDAETAYADRADRRFTALARLADGASPIEAARELNRIQDRLAAAYPETNRDLRVLASNIEGTRSESFFIALLVAVGLVLLVACTNVGNLLLARAAARRQEITLRYVLGASRGRVLAQLLVESTLLALGGALVGILLAIWGSDVMIAAVPTPEMPQWIDFRLDVRTLAHTLGLVGIAVLSFGLAPALFATQRTIGAVTHEGSHRVAGDRRSSRLRSTFIVAEVALSVVLLSSAALMMRSALATANADPGYDPEPTLAVAVTLPESRYPDAAARARFIERAMADLQRAGGFPIVAAEGVLGSDGMAVGAGSSGLVQPAGRDSAITLPVMAVTPARAQAIGLPLLRGRTFQPGERSAVLLSRLAAARLWPDEENVIGRMVRVRGDWLQVVGIVGDRNRIGVGGGGDAAKPTAEVYVPVEIGIGASVTLLARTAGGDPLAEAAAVRTALRAIDADLPLTVMRLSDQVYDNVRILQWLGGLFTTFAAAALGLAALGLFGVIAYNVVQRTREIGVRMALGASPRDVVRLVLHTGTRLVLIGAAIGVLGTLATGRVLATMLFGVGAADPITILGVVLLLIAVATLAAWWPARRAGKVDPMVALGR